MNIQFRKKRIAPSWNERVHFFLSNQRQSRLAVAKAIPRWHCPKCEIAMKSEMLGAVMVEKCPRCQGLFFDAGELETLLGK